MAYKKKKGIQTITIIDLFSLDFEPDIDTLVSVYCDFGHKEECAEAIDLAESIIEKYKSGSALPNENWRFMTVH